MCGMTPQTTKFALGTMEASLSEAHTLNPLEKVQELVDLFLSAKINAEVFQQEIGKVVSSVKTALDKLSQVNFPEKATQGQTLQEASRQGLEMFLRNLESLVSLPEGSDKAAAEAPLENCVQSYQLLEQALKAIQAQRRL